MRLPRVRFTVRRMMLAVGIVAVMLAYDAWGPTTRGCGSASLPLTIHVVDDRDGRPVAGATIELIRDYSAPPRRAITGPDGSMQAIREVGSTSYSGPFFRRYRCFTYMDMLRVEAEGYQRVEEMLHEYTRDAAYHNTSAPRPISVRLKRSLGANAWNG